MTVFGYARVSTVGQTLEAQLAQLTAAGCVRIYREKLSGANANRPELQRAMSRLKADDVLMVTSLDRLARSTIDLLNIITRLTDKGATLRSLRESWTDTATAQGKFMLTIAGGVAEYERELIRTRTMEGRALAVARGVQLGRPPKLTPAQKAEAFRRRRAGETLVSIAKAYAVDETTISRICAKAAKDPARVT
jgi:DNA invertase Pin-like site-specific DNA recombinase